LRLTLLITTFEAAFDIDGSQCYIQSKSALCDEKVIIMNTAYVGIIREGKVEFETPVALAEGSQVVVFPSQLDEQAARRRANRWLAEHVGNVAGTEKQGVLQQIDNQIVWRFEVFVSGVTYSTPIGPLGQVDVEANTGQILNTQQTAQEMMKRGKELASLP
jgi:hypothetical protein